MNYENLSKEELIEIVEELKILNNQLLAEDARKVKLDFSWTGNLGHWYWNIKTNTVTFNPLKITTLGYSENEIPERPGYQFFTDKLHSEDYQKTMDAMLAHLNGEVNVYEVEYRIRTKDGNYKWYYDRGRITQFDKQGKPIFLAGIVFDISEKKELQQKLENKNKKLEELSTTDELTKIRNYRALIEHLESEVAFAKFYSKPISLAIFDIDNFKMINDNKGHQYGNKALIEIADIMNKNIRETDLLGRYGGEEFMIVFSNTNLKDATDISERIRQSIEKYVFDDNICITVSAGIKEYHGEDLSEFIQAADANLFEAKKKGRNLII